MSEVGPGKAPQFDVVIVGGGVAGALIAKKLAGAGKHILILEAGTSDAMDPGHYRQFLENYYAMGSGRGAPNGPYPHNPDALSPNNANSSPYYVQAGPKPFLSDYLRMLGGSTLHFQGTSLRMVPNDFRMQSTYGQGVNWPIGYDDLEPAYREAEREIGVAADVEDQRNFGIWFPDGYVYPMWKMPQSVIDQFFDEKLQGVTVPLYGGDYPVRVISIPVARNTTPNPAYDHGRGYRPVSSIGDRDSGTRCQGNSNCLPLCPVQAKYNALKTIAVAVRTGKLEIRNQSVASKLLIDPGSGRITAVQYHRYADPNKTVFTTETVAAKIFVLAANAIQNAVLMLASNLADSSGQIGRNLMDHPYLVFFGLAPQPVWPFRGPDTTSGIESLRDGKFREQHASFRASLGNWGWIGEPGSSVAKLLAKKVFGKDFRNQLADRLSRMVKFGAMLEQLPHPNNRVMIDPAHTDSSGINLPVLSYDYANYTLDGAVATIETVWPAITQRTGIHDHTSDVNLFGVTAVSYKGKDFFLGGSGHLVGTHRMGNSPGDSVVDQYLRTWGHSNLYAVGAGSMVTIGTSNPTLTLAALSFRAADSIIADLR